MKMYSLMLLGCLVTLATPVYTYADEGQVPSCEQEAKDLGITDQQELSDFIAECEAANSGEEPVVSE